MKESKPYVTTLRDRIVWYLCNCIVNHVATQDYRHFLNVTYVLGVEQFEVAVEQRGT